MLTGSDYTNTVNTYDPSGKRVKKRTEAPGSGWNEYPGATNEFYFYGIGGQKLVTLTCQSECAPPQYNVYFGGKLVKSKGVVVVTDRLGSVRANAVGERMTYYPHGEEKTSTGDGREKFGTYFRDSTLQDYADQRYYAVGMGRFNSADPSSGVNPGSPATWNKYAYVVGDPVNFYDPHGLNVANPGYCPPEYSSCYDPGGGSEGEGGGEGPGGGGSCSVAAGMGVVPVPDPTCYVEPPPPPPAPVAKPSCWTGGALNDDEYWGSSVILGENSWYLLGHASYQAGDSRGTPTGPVIDRPTVLSEDFAFASSLTA
jgi:RHS repeat-associated protein